MILRPISSLQKFHELNPDDPELVFSEADGGNPDGNRLTVHILLTFGLYMWISPALAPLRLRPLMKKMVSTMYGNSDVK
jgi:hypothetical protein